MENNILLNKLHVEGLFNTFNYDIERSKNSPIVIITGPNGFGKTTLLLSIVNVYKCKLSYFLSFPFRKIRFEMMQDGHNITLELTQTHTEQRNVDSDILESNDIESLRVVLDADGIHDDQTRTMAEVEELLSGYGYSKHLEGWIKNGERFTLNTIFADLLLESALFDRVSIGDVIGMQKVIFKSDNRREDYPAALERIRMQVEKYTQEINDTFTAHFADFLNAKACGSDLDEEQIADLKRIASSIKQFGMSDVDPTTIENYDVLGSVMGKVMHKVDKEFLSPLKLYYEAIEDKQFENKHMVVNRQGLHFYTNDTNELISPESLSSGEKQVVALYFDLFFNNDVRMVVIDEPEMSWHVSWQVDFMEEMKDFARLKECQVIVATHSPYIINKCNNLKTDLYAQSSK